MPALPGTIALTNIPDGASIVAADHRNNYAAVQAAVNALIGLFSNGSLDGEAMVWDATNTKWVAASSLAAGRPRAPRVTISTMAGGPPASPIEGDIWVATAVDANGTRWSFQYNAGSASASKWEYFGGDPVIAEVTTSEATTSAAYVALATAGPSITVARAGDYNVEIGALISSSSNGQRSRMSYDIGGTGAVDADNIQLCQAGGVNGAEASLARKRLKTAIAAATALTTKYRGDIAVNSTFGNRYISVLPERIS